MIIFSNSCVFWKAAEHAKLKGMKALGSLWNLFTNGKINNWDTHRKLFDSIVTSTVLYSGQIWAMLYMDILEKVQSKFLRRTFHLGFTTPTFAMRIETGSSKLKTSLAKLIINFVIRILHLEESRIARICYEELSKTADVDPKRYNWVTSMRDFLNLENKEELQGSINPLDWICSKSEILKQLTSELTKDDTERAIESERFKYLAHLDSG
jgi:hypothetical protein